MSDVAVSRVVLTIGKKEIPLSLEEAKELRDILNATFGEKVVERYYPYPAWNPPAWPQPRYKSLLPGQIPMSQTHPIHWSVRNTTTNGDLHLMSNAS